MMKAGNFFALLGMSVVMFFGCFTDTALGQQDQSLKEARAKKPTPGIHSKGTFAVVYGGVLIDEAKPNEDGPYVFRAIDLDDGKELPRSLPTTDASIVVNGRTLGVRLEGYGNKSVDVGPARANFWRCRDTLPGAKDAPLISMRAAPTNYACVQTSEGRVSLFRVLTVDKTFLQPRFFKIIANVEYTTWEPALY